MLENKKNSNTINYLMNLNLRMFLINIKNLNVIMDIFLALNMNVKEFNILGSVTNTDLANQYLSLKEHIRWQAKLFITTIMKVSQTLNQRFTNQLIVN